MKLVLADAENAPERRLPDVVVLHLVREAGVVWIWSESLRAANQPEELHLFNIEPPFGMQANLGLLNWGWRCEGLAIFELPKGRFDRHFRDVTEVSQDTGLLAGQTLREVLASAIRLGGTDLHLLAAIAALASTGEFKVESIKDLETYLQGIVVPPAEHPHGDSQGSPSINLPEGEKLRGVRRLSVWTPGTSESEFVAFYEPLIGNTEAMRLWAVSQASVGAVAAGQFDKQVDLATELAGSVSTSSVLAGEAAYFRAEGLRLLGDIEPSVPRQEELRAEAVEQYQHAISLLPNDPRPVRGIGRITELRGDFDGALNYFTTAKGLCLTEMSRDSTVPRLDLAHEVLRTTRHFIHCLLDIRATSATSVWHRAHKERELAGFLQECENLHRDIMPTFRGEPEWFYIEWFMGLVFLAKAWGVLEQYTHMQTLLIQALEARRHIMRPSTSISAVERANLEWWLAVARGQGNVFEADFLKGLERLDSALKSSEPATVVAAMDDIVRPFAAPWSPISERSIL